MYNLVKVKIRVRGLLVYEQLSVGCYVQSEKD